MVELHLFSNTVHCFFDGYESLICACSTDLSLYCVCVMLEARALNHQAAAVRIKTVSDFFFRVLKQ